MNVQPYLSFEGRAQEAIDFYKSAVGAKVEMVMQFKEAPPEMQANIAHKDKIMHSAFKVGDTTIMATDGQCSGKSTFSGITLTINATSNGEAEKLFNALAQGGKVNMPMSETFFAHRFGMVNDKFGVGWMVLNPKQPG
jgi:PhnB protein